MKIKIKLTKQEMQALYAVMSDLVPRIRALPEHQERKLKLQNLALSEIMTALFLKLTMRIENGGQKHSISLKMTEAWALNKSLQPHIDMMDDYSMTVCLNILQVINQKTA